MSKRILIAEDSARDAGDIEKIASEYGTPTTITSFASTLEVLQSRTNWDLLILDLKMPGSDPQNTVDAVRVLGLRMPIIVVTGYEDPSIRQQCESMGWAWVAKDSGKFASSLHHAIRQSIDCDDSGDSFSVQQSSGTQLKAILAMLADVKLEQKKTNERLEKIETAVDIVFTQMYGEMTPAGFRGGGCVQRHQQAMQIVQGGKAWLWIAISSVAASAGGLVSWILSQVTK